MNPLVVLMYGAIAFSLGVYVWRAYRHVAHNETREDRAERRRAAREANATGPLQRPVKPGSANDARRMTTRERKAAERAGEKPSVDDLGGDVPLPTPLPATDDDRIVEAVLREGMAKQNAGGEDAPLPLGAGPSAEPGAGSTLDTSDRDSGSARGGVFAKRGTERVPVSELVQGIELPCDLAPWIVAGEDLDPYDVVFLTTGFDVSDVGAGIADELERLGFSLRSDSETTLVATRDGKTLRVTVYPDATNAKVGSELLFPTAPGGSVAVELES